MPPSRLGVRNESQTRVFPNSRPIHGTTVPLSVVDASVVRFSTTAAVCYFDTPTDDRGRAALLPRNLQSSLQQTLNSYPQWIGQLQWAPYDPNGDHTRRVGRLCLSYGYPTDPGVEFVVASSDIHITSLIPTPSERTTGHKWWDAAQIPSNELLPSTELPLHNLVDFTGLPGMMVQITTFACGMVAVGVKMVHPLADAQTLARFVHDWARTSRCMLDDLSLPILTPVFDPQKVDQAAAGEINARQPDPALVERARALPMHRYDWCASADGSPPKMPLGLEPAAEAPGGAPIPWSDWETEAPLSHYLIHFSRDEVQLIWERARSSCPPSTPVISRLDALIAYIWTLINRARGLENDVGAVHITMSIGIRSRLSPPLPEGFLGSPIVSARVSATGQEASSETTGLLAARIRLTITLFDAQALAALLHDMAHDAALVRLWHACLGRRDLIVTSWLNLHLYEVDFGAGSVPRYVEAVMPSCDGCVQIMEAAAREATYGKKQKHWCDDGVDVSLHITTETMQKILGVLANSPILGALPDALQLRYG